MACFCKKGEKNQPDKTTGQSRRTIVVNFEKVVPSDVTVQERFIVNSRGMMLFTQKIAPKIKPIGLIFICHGYVDSCSVGSGRELAIDWASEGYITIGIDYEGHGKSDGLFAYIPDVHNLVGDVSSFFDSVRSDPLYHNLPCFLFGNSLGGAVAIEIALRQPSAYAGMILLAPMCKISDKLKPHPVIVNTLRQIAGLFPEKPWTPGADLIDCAFKIPEKRAKIRASPFYYGEKTRLGTAVSLLNFTDYLESRLGDVTTPFLLCHGSDDKVTDPAVSRVLFEKAASADKNFNCYEGMWHVLLCEPEENRLKVWGDIVDWVLKRSRIAP